MRLTWRSHSAIRIEAGAANIFARPFLSDNPSRDKGWIGLSRRLLGMAKHEGIMDKLKKRTEEED